MSTDLVKSTLELKHKNKSYIFLYPTLYLKDIHPVQTYMGFDNYSLENKLICLFHINQTNLKNIEETCRSHDQFDFAIVDGEYIYIAFTFMWKKELYSLIKQGKYSQIKGSDRSLILWGKHKEYLDMALTPQSYYSEFAKDFQCSEQELAEQKAELVSPPDMESEYLHVNKSLDNEIQTQLEIKPIGV